MKYSEEELKAIEVLKNKKHWECLAISGKTCLDIVLNLISKQQKEIENSVSKDKIREKQLLREFELQQEYKEFEEDEEWNRYKELLEE